MIPIPMIAQIVLLISELSKIGTILISEEREPTVEETERVRDAVKRANALWEQS